MSARSTARQLLRDRGPLTVDELIELARAIEPIAAKDPKKTIANTLQMERDCQLTADGRWVFLPTFINGACMRAPMGLINHKKHLLAVSGEVIAFLWPSGLFRDARTLALEGGRKVKLSWAWMGGGRELYTLIKPSETFWKWWVERGSPEHILICCCDGESGLYEVSTAPRFDGAAIEAANARLNEAATSIFRRVRQTGLEKFTRRLVASGVYHESPPPDPAAALLFGENGPLGLNNWEVVDLSRMSAASRKLAAETLGEERRWGMSLIREALGMPPEEMHESEPPPESNRAKPDGKVYRLRVRLQWMPNVWRVIEATDDQTLQDIHLAIQDAFGWDNDHLYTFFMSGKARDRLTEIPGWHPYAEPETDRTSDAVTLADLELPPRHRFLYIFDFGDNLRHDIDVLGIDDTPSSESFIRISESHGEAPPQYPNWDDEDL